MFKKGDKLKCIDNSGYCILTKGKEYTALENQKPGVLSIKIFEGDLGKPVSAFASRFKVVRPSCDICGDLTPDPFHIICDD